MILNFVKTSVRYLYRNKLFTTLNIIGLAVGLSACWIIFCVVGYEFSFDTRIPGRENIYRIVTGLSYDGRESVNGGTSKPLPDAVRDGVAGVKSVVRVYKQYIDAVKADAANKTVRIFDSPEDVVAIDRGYFSMVPYLWLAGKPESALSSPDQVILTESRAKKYFPGLSPEKLIGRTIIYDDSVKKEISGIVRDLEYSTAFTGKEFFPIRKRAFDDSEWTNVNGDDKVYIELLEQADPEKVIKQINRISKERWDAFNRNKKDPFTDDIRQWQELRPLSEMHFSTEINEGVHKVSKTVLYGLLLIGLFLLSLAAINYINLSTAQIPQRTKEFGVRKTLGSARSQLMGQVLTEAFLMTVLALLLSWLFSELIFAGLKDIIPEGVPQYAGVKARLVFNIVIALTLPFLAGIYPALLVAKANPLKILRKQMLIQTSGGLSFRKGLIIFQFLIAQIFIVSTIIVGSQIRYLMKKDPGFDKDAVLLIEIPWKLRWKEEYQNKKYALLNEIRNLPNVTDASLGDPPMSTSFNSGLFSYTDEHGKKSSGQLYRKEVDTRYIDVYRMKLIAGRNLNAADTASELVINETAVRHFGLKSPRDAVGQVMETGGAKLAVVGVVRDFHSQSFYNHIDPLGLMVNKDGPGCFNIRLSSANTGDWKRTIDVIRNKWSRFYPPENFDYKFYDQSLEAMYKQEKDMATLINLATLISIVISCLGLFGLAALAAFQRTKEIGIRKVMGATAGAIVKMLSLDFIKLVFVSIAIGLPVAWYSVNKWLNGFAFRIEVQWWMLLAGGLAVSFVALATVSFHALRAAAAKPVDTLRSE